MEDVARPEIHLSPRCTHCHSECSDIIKGDLEQEIFCCLGCQSVYSFLKEHDLAHQFYQIKENGPQFAPTAPVALNSEQFLFLTQADFKRDYVQRLSSGLERMVFYIEGIHCLACIWILEKVALLVDGAQSAKLDLSRSHLSVVIHPEQTNFAQVAAMIANLGYRPHPIKEDEKAQHLKRKDERKTLVRIGLAAFCAGNIMVYNAGLYTGASGNFANNFGFATALLATPALTYSAYPFYQQAWRALVKRMASIDIPIALGLILGGGMSFYRVFNGNPDNYFDTLVTLVFLVLFSRFALSKLTQKGLDASQAGAFLGAGAYQVKRAGEAQYFSRHSSTLAKGDLIKVLPGMMIPVDGVVTSGISSVHYALLTGEAAPLRVGPEVEVRHGAINLDDEMTVQAHKVSEHTTLGRMIEELRNSTGEKPEIVSLSATAAKFLIIVVPFLCLALITYFALQGEAAIGFDRALALLVITCPCALGLSIPLTFALGLRRGERQGLLIKDESVLEKITHLRNIAFDKTGTLTEGHLKLKKLELTAELSKSKVAAIIFALERPSRHPIALSLCEALAGDVERRDLVVSGRSERAGSGVKGEIEGCSYEIKPLKNEGAKSIKLLGLFAAGELVARLELADRLRPGVSQALEELRRLGANLHLLSGDEHQIVQAQTGALPIPPESTHSELLPAQKVALLKEMKGVMMVGDGVNDAYALKSAMVGVAVKGSSDVSIRSADVYATRAGLASVVDLMRLGKQTALTLKIIIGYSLCYNIISISAAISGYVSPLWAAIFMPLSSITSFGLTTFFMREHK